MREGQWSRRKNQPVKCAVVNLHTSLTLVPPVRSSFLFHDEFVVEAKLALGHARELRLHHDLAVDFGAQDVAVARGEKGHGLVHVDEHFVFTVAETVSSPVNGARDLRRQRSPRIARACHVHDTALVDIELQYVNGTILRVSVVHRLVKELVNESKVGLESVVGEFVANIRLEDTKFLKEVLKDEHNIGRTPRCRNQKQVHVLDKHERRALDHYNGIVLPCTLARNDLASKGIDRRSRHVTAVGSRHHLFALLVHKQNHARHTELRSIVVCLTIPASPPQRKSKRDTFLFFFQQLL